MKNNYSANSDPAATNDSSQGYAVGSTWINVASGTIWQCSSASAGAAVWMNVGSASASILVRARGNLASRAPTIYDNFDAPDDTPVQGRISPTGQTWVCTGPGAQTLAIKGGRMTAKDNCYNYLPVQPGTFYRQSEVVSFVPGPNGVSDRGLNNAVMLATADLNLMHPDCKFFHAQVTPDGYVLQQTATGIPGLNTGAFGIGSWKTPWPTDDTPLNCSIEYDFTDRAATIFGPDGQARTHAFSAAPSGDVGIQQSDISYVGWQMAFYGPNWMVESGPSLAGALASSGSAAPMGIVSPIYGSGFRKLNPFSLQLAGGGNAWFRVMNGGVWGNPNAYGWAIAGTMRFDATDYTDQDGAITAWEFDCTAVNPPRHHSCKSNSDASTRRDVDSPDSHLAGAFVIQAVAKHVSGSRA
ncbi:hypothetical protein MA20_40505 [Bradyrhizobium japonicum]|uniref:Uncharacterized protein n=1 Tax=Bradyrhizobium japonicum TaxID=375 RepID=A0A0A3XM61_BRAJP|nr:hypothetical protein [Bradyrhizobium japonicum]KGT74359.1 hypothetical protein MA20_40505 [Bradyrhizobium japonicum]MCS3900196.1 hypothetical protein [Bradyrhizobium japonicum USDA 38]MCS3943250.1 hypothetical protein [Bradyrhizobium japonicum]MCW2224050.1 hypothetical protein [Bradyrhizobium japonicum]MCW2339292.1 hypothetical protein [Bradyrhizobium japonicum]